MSFDVNKQAGIAETTIGDYLFTIDLLPFAPAGEVFVDLCEILGPSVGIIIDKLRTTDYVLPEEDNAFTEVFGVFCSRLAQGQHKKITDAILKGCTINGEKFDPNKHLKGEFGVGVALMQFALKENFSSFFIDWLAAMGLTIPSLNELKDMIKKPQPTQPEETQQESSKK